MNDQQFSQMMDELQESKIEPFEPYIPLLIAVSLFFMLNSIVAIVSFLPLFIITGIVKLLRAMKIVDIVKETREVERLVLT